MRAATVTRTTSETDITVQINLDGSGTGNISTGIPFMDHMLTLFARHGLFDLDVKAKGDLAVDCHHTMEDLGLALGEAVARALGGKSGIRRYGFFLLPMDEALAETALDLSGRPFLDMRADFPARYINNLDVQLFNEFFRALTVKAGMNLHIRVKAGDDSHHIAEAIFKSFAKALDAAVTPDPRIQGVLSTKGTL